MISIKCPKCMTKLQLLELPKENKVHCQWCCEDVDYNFIYMKYRYGHYAFVCFALATVVALVGGFFAIGGLLDKWVHAHRLLYVLPPTYTLHLVGCVFLARKKGYDPNLGMLFGMMPIIGGIIMFYMKDKWFIKKNIGVRNAELAS